MTTLSSVSAKTRAVALAVAVLIPAGVWGAPALGSISPGVRVVNASAPLSDLQPGVDPLDGAAARLVATAFNGGTRVILIVTRISPAAVGRTFGAHIHVGPCVEGNGAAAGKHYNTGGAPSPTTEVWLDFTVRPGGVGVSRTTVPFIIPPGGANSLVIHAQPTGPGGVAGPRLACLPVTF